MGINVCMNPSCQTSAGCQCNQHWPVYHNPSPRTMPVNLPFSSYGVTIAIMDSDGNVTVKVDQPKPDAGQ